MTVEADLYSRLTGFAGLAALVGNRVYPQMIPQAVTMPAISYQRVSTIRTSVMRNDIDIVRSRFQVDVWAKDFDEGEAITAQVLAALQRYRGTGTVEILAVFSLEEIDLYEPETEIYHQALDFEINYRESP